MSAEMAGYPPLEHTGGARPVSVFDTACVWSPPPARVSSRVRESATCLARRPSGRAVEHPADAHADGRRRPPHDRPCREPPRHGCRPWTRGRSFSEILSTDVRDIAVAVECDDFFETWIRPFARLCVRLVEGFLAAAEVRHDAVRLTLFGSSRIPPAIVRGPPELGGQQSKSVALISYSGFPPRDRTDSGASFSRMLPDRPAVRPLGRGAGGKRVPGLVAAGQKGTVPRRCPGRFRWNLGRTVPVESGRTERFRPLCPVVSA